MVYGTRLFDLLFVYLHVNVCMFVCVACTSLVLFNFTFVFSLVCLVYLVYLQDLRIAIPGSLSPDRYPRIAIPGSQSPDPGLSISILFVMIKYIYSLCYVVLCLLSSNQARIYLLSFKDAFQIPQCTGTLGLQGMAGIDARCFSCW